MSEEWRGLHNHEWHEWHDVGALGYVTCNSDSCSRDHDCHPNRHCRCCLAAEVEALRAQVQSVRELHSNHDDCPEGFEECFGQGKCRKCGEPYPCSTVRALDGGTP